jgi:hypothetical protein
MIVDQREADPTPFNDWTEQLSDAHARPRGRSNVDLMERKKPVPPINHGNVQFLLFTPC